MEDPSIPVATRARLHSLKGSQGSTHIITHFKNFFNTFFDLQNREVINMRVRKFWGGGGGRIKKTERKNSYAILMLFLCYSYAILMLSYVNS